MDVIAYARVSSATQELDVQIGELKKYCDYKGDRIVKMFTDKASGKNLDRRGFQEMVNLLDKNTLGIKAIVIYKLDRIGRSLSDLIRIVEWLKTKDIELVSISDNIDTTTSQGCLFFQLIGAIAEYERKLINERTELGRREALASGTKFGRPRKDIPLNDIRKDLAMGLSKAFVAKKYGIKRSTLYVKLNEDKNNVKI